MPIEGKRTYIGHQLDPELSAHLQGKTFTRSVSIGESTVNNSNDSEHISAYDDPSVSRPVPTAGASTRSVSGGDIELLSPSPLSSFTATASTVSTGSPQRPDASPEATTPLDEQVSDTVALTMTTDYSGSNSGGDPSIASVMQPLPSAQLRSLLSDPNSRRTMNLLTHLLDIGLPSEWRNELLRRWSTVGSPLITSGSDIPDGDFILSQQPVMPLTQAAMETKADVLSLSEDVSVTKRVKLNESKPVNHTPSSVEDNSNESKGMSHQAFISPSLVKSMARLVEIYESLYREKLGNLIDDVARLRSSENTPSSQTSESDVIRPPSSGVDDTSLDDKASCSLTAAQHHFHTLLSAIFEDGINWGRVVAMLAFVKAICEVAETKRTAASQAVVEATASDGQSLGQEVHAAPSQSGSEATLHSGVPPASTDAASRSLEGVAVRQLAPTSTAVNTSGLPFTSSPDPADYLLWTTAFIHQPKGVWNWIASHGGWDGLKPLDYDPGLGGEGGSSTANSPRALISLPDDDTVLLLQRAITGVAAIAVGAMGLAAAMRFFSRRI